VTEFTLAPPASRVTEPISTDPEATDRREAEALASRVVEFVQPLRIGAAVSYLDWTPGLTVLDLRHLAQFEVYSVEWHGNRVGDRWQRSGPIECTACQHFDVTGIELFDGRAWRVELADYTEVSTHLGAAILCEVVRSQLAASRSDLELDRCTCEPPAQRDPLSTLSLPSLEPEMRRPCDTRLRSGFDFYARSPPTDAKVIGSLRIRSATSAGQLAVNAYIQLEGPPRAAFLGAMRLP